MEQISIPTPPTYKRTDPSGNRTEVLSQPDSLFEMGRTSRDTRDITGTITLGPELLRRIIRAYLDDDRSTIQLKVIGQKVLGCPRFTGQLSFSEQQQ